MKKLAILLAFSLIFTSAYAVSDLSRAFKSCIQESLNDDGLVMPAKKGVKDSDLTTISFSCEGRTAETLFKSVKSYAISEKETEFVDEEVGRYIQKTRFIGDLNLPSQCHKFIYIDADRENGYSCGFMLDMVGSLIKALDLY